MGDIKDRLIIFSEDYGKTVLAVLAVVALILLGLVAMSDEKEEKGVGSEEAEYEEIKEKSNKLAETFSLLGEMQIAPSNKYLAYEVDLYLKKPFLTAVEYRRAIEDYIEVLKWQTNRVDGKTVFIGAKITVYDREVLYQEGVGVRGRTTYMLREENEKERKKEDKYLQDVDMRWEHTITQKKKPDYDKYKATVSFTEYSRKSGVQPLSDEEFEFYMKLDKYAILTGGPVSGVGTYLRWDLGQDKKNKRLRQTRNEFKKFRERLTGIGAPPIYHNDLRKVRSQMAIENPRFLVYTLNGAIIDDKLTAKRMLIYLDRKFYTDIFVKDAQDRVKRGESISEYEDESTEGAIQGGELTDEEASKILGVDVEDLEAWEDTAENYNENDSDEE